MARRGKGDFLLKIVKLITLKTAFIFPLLFLDVYMGACILLRAVLIVDVHLQ